MLDILAIKPVICTFLVDAFLLNFKTKFFVAQNKKNDKTKRICIDFRNNFTINTADSSSFHVYQQCCDARQTCHNRTVLLVLRLKAADNQRLAMSYKKLLFDVVPYY